MRPDRPCLPFAESALATVSFALFLLRIWPRLQNPQLWAEDGTVFLSAALDHAAPQSLFTIYQGYFHFIPMGVAEFSSLFDLGTIPVVFAVTNVILVGVLYYLIFRLIQHAALRFTAYIVIPLSIGSNEVYGTITNFQWFFAILAISLVTQAFDKRALPLYALALTTGPFFIMGLAARATHIAMTFIPRMYFTQTQTLVLVAIAIILGAYLRPLIRLVALSFGSMVAVDDSNFLSYTVLLSVVTGLLILWHRFSDWEKILLYWLAVFWLLIAWKFARTGPEYPVLDGWGGRYFFPTQFVLVALILSALLRAQLSLLTKASLYTGLAVLFLFANTTDSPIFFPEQSYEETWLKDVQEFERTGEPNFTILPGWTFTLSTTAQGALSQ